MKILTSSNPKLIKLLPSSVAAALFMTLSFTQAAKAELIINSSVDDKGRANMVVRDDRQKKLPPAQLGIQPSRISETVSLTNRKNLDTLNQSLTLYNYGSKPKNIKLSLIDIDATGAQIEPNENTLKPWTLINPTQFTIPADGYQTVRMSIRLPMDFATGKRLAVLSIEQQVDKSLTYDENGKGVTLELGSRYALPVRIDVK